MTAIKKKKWEIISLAILLSLNILVIGKFAPIFWELYKG